jgi:hypothetical protein
MVGGSEALRRSAEEVVVDEDVTAFHPSSLAGRGIQEVFA